MTREDIEQINIVEPYCFETDREEQWYCIGLKYGLDVADSNPKSTWISVEDDLPCNHEELVDKEKNMTKRVLIIGKDGKSNITPNIMSMFFIENCWQWACEIYFKVTYWMPIPKLPKE